MRFRIHFQWANGAEDSLVVMADDIDTIRTTALREMMDRGIDLAACWSEELTE